MESKAVFIIDMQPNYLQNIADETRRLIISKQLYVIGLCARYYISVFIIETDFLGNTITPIMGTMLSSKKAWCVKKDFDDAFFLTDLSQLMRTENIKSVFLTGINAEACVQDTAIGAIENNLSVASNRSVVASQFTGRDCGVDVFMNFLDKEEHASKLSFEDFLRKE